MRGMDGVRTSCGEPCMCWWRASWTPRYRSGSAPSAGSPTRSALPTANGHRSQPCDTRMGTPCRTWGVADHQDPGWQSFDRAAGTQVAQREGSAERSSASLFERVSTRRVDDQIKSLGCNGISKRQFSTICQNLDEDVGNFLGRPLNGDPYPTCGWTR